MLAVYYQFGTHPGRRGRNAVGAGVLLAGGPGLRLLAPGQHDALDRQQSLVDLVEADFHVAESFVQAVVLVPEPVHSTAQE